MVDACRCILNGTKNTQKSLLFYEKNVDAVNNDDDDDEANLIYDHGGFKNTTFSHVNRPSFLFVIIISYIQAMAERVNYSHVRI